MVIEIPLYIFGQDLAEEFDHELSRWLVDMEGPIRESSRMLEADSEMCCGMDHFNLDPARLKHACC